jgi:hypothetical protein
LRDVARIAPTSEIGNVRRWAMRARPRPREQPVMRYEAILVEPKIRVEEVDIEE